MTDLELMLYMLVVCVVLTGLLTGLLKYYEYKEFLSRQERNTTRRFDLVE